LGGPPVHAGTRDQDPRCPNMEVCGFDSRARPVVHRTVPCTNVALSDSPLTEHHAHQVRESPEVPRAPRALGRVLALPATADPAVQGSLLPHRPGQRRPGRRAGPKGHVCQPRCARVTSRPQSHPPGNTCRANQPNLTLPTHTRVVGIVPSPEMMEELLTSRPGAQWLAAVFGGRRPARPRGQFCHVLDHDERAPVRV
jgi:hypothetical protein